MGPGASVYDRRDPGGIGWATVIAVLFAAIAAISFAVDQNVTLSGLPPLPPVDSVGR